MITPLKLTLFGGVQFHFGQTLITGFRSSKTTALLCYLAMTATPFPRPILADLFWPELSESHANDSLRVTLSNLRSLVGAHLTITRQTVTFNADAPYWLDVREFSEAMEGRGQTLSIKQLRNAAALYRGDFLAGFHVQDAPAFEHWASIQQMQLRDLAVRAFHTLVAYYAQPRYGTHSFAIEYANRLLALEPWEEETHQLVMLLLAVGGQPAAAVRQFEICRSVLSKELGMEPNDQTVELIARIRKGELQCEDALDEVMAITTRLGTVPVLEFRSPVLSSAVIGSSDTPYFARAIEGVIYE
jgi:DNA-binding SARP family transcriptional activator